MTENNPLEDYEQRWASQALTGAIERGDSEILVRGPRGVGKTIDFCWRFHNYALQYPGMTQIWSRSTRTRLTDSVLKTFEDEILGPRHPLSNKKQREQRTHYRYPNGSEIMLTGLEDYERAKSVSADLIWVNEPTEITERQWEEIGGAARKRMRSVCPFRLKIGDFNPTWPGHWTEGRCATMPTNLYPKVLDDGTRMSEWLTQEMYREITRFNLARNTSHKAKLIVFCAADNPGYWEIDPWGWKPAGLEYAINILGKMHGTQKSRYLAGKPTADSGAVFPEFDEDVHLVDDFYPPEDWPQILMYDPGYGTTAIEFMTISDDGGLYVFDEIYESKMDIGYYCHEICKRKKDNDLRILRHFGDPNEVDSDASQGPSVAKQALKMGADSIRFQDWPRQAGRAFEAGVEMIRTLLLGRPGTGKHYLRICKRCKGLRSNMTSWNYAKNRAGEVVEGAEKYQKGDDHGIDCVRGGISSNFLQSMWAATQRSPVEIRE